MTSLPDERLTSIRARLQREGRVIAADLAREFATSEDTIRRDLRELAAVGHCRRVYGGALPLSPASGPLGHRTAQRPDAKAALGWAAAALVQPRQFVFIDSGSTNLWIAKSLPDDMKLHVVTNAPAIAIELASRPSIEVILLGGRLNGITGGTVGAGAVRALQGLRFDLAFVGTCAADPRFGLAVFDSEEAELKRAAVEASAAVAAAITDEKLGTHAHCVVATCADTDHLILETDESVARWGRCDGGPALHAAARSGAPR